MKINIKKIIFILVIYLIYTNFLKGYYSYYPTIPIYPNNEKGLLMNIKTFYDKHPEPVEECEFKYDLFGNILERQEYKQGVLIRDFQIIFDTKTGLLHSIIDRNPVTNFMSIVRFTKYEYYQ